MTQNSLKTLYRFYGARHAHINLGYKLDFEAISSTKTTISMLKNVLHLGNKWMSDPKRFFIWQQFIKLLYKHLRDVRELDNFYLHLLDKMNHKFQKQNPMRVAIESYIALLQYEGRLHSEFRCLICEESILDNLTITRGFLPAHKRCINIDTIDKDKIKELFITHSTIYLNNDEVNKLWIILLEGF